MILSCYGLVYTHARNSNNIIIIVCIFISKILMPGNSTNIQTNLPDQKVIVESFKADQWPLPQLASIKNQSITLFNNLKKPVFLIEKKATTIKIIPATITDIRHITHTKPQLQTIKPTNILTDAETIGLIKYGKIDSNIKRLLETAYSKHKKVFDRLIWRLQRLLQSPCLQTQLVITTQT